MNEEPETATPPPSWSQRLLAECFGTFALAFVAGGADIFALSGGHVLGHFERYAAPGLVVMAMIYSLGECSGAHLNPAVTFAFALRKDIHWHDVPRYSLAQIIGATLAGGALYWFTGARVALAINQPGTRFTALDACVAEALLTWLLVFVILGTAAQSKITGPNAAIAVGATIAVCGLFFSPVSGASMNPARTIGPMIAAFDFQNLWVYVVGPYAGAILAVLLAYAIHGPPDRHEKKAGKGERHP